VTEPHNSAFVEAEITLLTPEEGGRRSAIRSGYRPNFRLDHVDGEVRGTHDATIWLHGTDALSPGSTARARVYPHVPDSWSDVTAGSRLELREGARVVGRAVVIVTSWEPSGHGLP
jgi:translation elongation factor EF-Tu-like GTPase